MSKRITLKRPESSPLIPGTTVKPYGRIEAVSFRDGERYYMLLDGPRNVSLMPAGMIEDMWREQNPGASTPSETPKESI